MTKNDWLDGKVPGLVSFTEWESYPWKNELSAQSERVLKHFYEILDAEFDGQHRPQDMLERALVLAAFCVRRLIEKRLITDELRSKKIELRTFVASAETEFRRPFHSQSGGDFFHNYEYASTVKEFFSLKGLADEIIHSSQLMTIHGVDFIESGILVASDWHLQSRVIHLSPVQFRKFVASVLDDRVNAMSDTRDLESGKVSSRRE